MRIASKKPAGRSLDYVERVNRAIDFILRNLDQPLRLETVARAACFSPFHFHRIFRLMVGESIAEFVKRVRLERALVLISRRGWGTRRRQSLTDIALACGFASSSDFARCFKQRFGVAARDFDVEAFRGQRREAWLSALEDPVHRNQLKRLPPGANPDGFQVRLRQLPPRCVAYIRVQDSYRPDAVCDAAARLTAWAERRGLADGQWLGYQWDDPEIVAHKDCRYDIGLVIPVLTPRDSISRIEFPRCRWRRSKSAAGSISSCARSTFFSPPGSLRAATSPASNPASKLLSADPSPTEQNTSSSTRKCPWSEAERSFAALAIA